jgi:hypothetical protein
MLNKCRSVGVGASEEEEVLVWVGDDEGSGAPGCGLEGLIEGDARSLEIEKELFDFAGGGNCDGGGEKGLALANIAGEDGFADESQVDVGLVADDLGVEGRIAVGECDGEAEPGGVEVAGCLDIGDVELGFDSVEDGAGVDGWGSRDIGI